MEYKTIRYHVDGGIALITLNRPHRNNAWTGRMETEYHHAMYQAERDDTAGVIVLTGEGRNFCVGADSKALEIHAEAGAYDSGVREPLLEPGDPGHPAYGTPHGFPLAMAKPVIAAVNGAAAGIGFVVACFADIRIAAEGAKLTPSSSKLGLPAEHAVSWILPRLIGYGRATEIMLSSRVVSADEALAIGLVNAVYPRDQLLERVMEYARMLIDSAAPSSLRVTKAQLSQDLYRPLRESAEESARLIDEMVGSDEFNQGVAAHTERRSPGFAANYRRG
ncbi:MAG TPA: enoyl-CoA hydratase-related protein [Pseudonocardia sp.]|nr:enoyl-CoA hydratase-related protein [Pseudonocardia sp.]